MQTHAPLIVLAYVALGTAVYSLFEGWPLIDAGASGVNGRSSWWTTRVATTGRSAFEAAAERHVVRFNTQDLANMAWAFAWANC